ncbi:HEAT repeat domain-containing protein, partial [Akkermansiaceae bacterium]|nr:HEAT repeat domain-containing protein [Akkermansiaceae bacterium]
MIRSSQWSFSLREETAHILRERSFAVSVGRLAKYLEHPDQRVRFKGQFELVKRGFLEELQMATSQLDKIGRIHAIWGIGQLHRKKESPDFKFLLDLLSDPDVEIRTQVIKIIGDHFGTQLALHQATAPSVESSSVAQALKPFLKDSSPRVKFHTAIALGNIGSAIEVDAIHDLLGQAGEENTYLRHAAIVLATGCSPDADLVALAKHDSELIQKVAVVALRRRASSSVTHFLSSPYENVVAEAARTIHDDWTIPEAIPNLAASLETTPWGKNQSIILRTINASFHLGTPEAAQRVAAFSTRSDVPIKLRLDALDALSKWTQPKKLDRVVGRYRPLAERDSTIAKDALSSQLSKLLIDPESSIQSKAMSLARSLEIELPSEALVTLAENKDSLPELKVEALRALHSQEYSRIQELLTAALQAKQADVRIEALALLAHSNPEQALNTIDQILQKKGGNLSEKQAALALLIDPLTNNKASLLLLKFVGISDTMPAGLQLDLAEAAAVRKINYIGPNFSQTLVGGNAERGEDIFMNHL